MAIKSMDEHRPTDLKGGSPMETFSTIPHVNATGISMIATALIIIGEMAGGGIIAMPGALRNSSYLGMVLIFVAAVLTAYTGIQLGKCWTMLQMRWPEHHQHTRKPYQEIARRAVGVPLMHVTSFCVDFTLFGACVAFLVVGSENISSLLTDWFSWDVSFCFIILVLGAILLPVIFLGSPKDFWFVVAGAMGATTIASVLLIIGMIIDVGETGHYNSSVAVNSTNTKGVPISEVGFKEFWLAFGTIIFAYGGHSAFPTIQHDMREPAKFKQSIIYAYLVIICLYAPVSIVAFYVYGDNTDPGNVINNIGPEWCKTTVFVLITFHVLLTFVIIANPVTQELEQILKVPHKFGWKRVILRTLYMVAVVFFAETIPRFGLLLSLIGSSTITALTFIFPGIFYISLKRQQKMTVWATDGSSYPSGERKLPIPWWSLVINVIIILIGIIGAVAGTYAALDTLIEGQGKFTPPCYVNGGKDTS